MQTSEPSTAPFDTKAISINIAKKLRENNNNNLNAIKVLSEYNKKSSVQRDILLKVIIIPDFSFMDINIGLSNFSAKTFSTKD